MAASIFQWPFGFSLGAPVNAAIISSGGNAQIQSTAHGLQNGSLIYLQSNVDNYNVFGYVDSVTANAFFVLPFYSGGNQIPWIVDCPITYYPSVPTGPPVISEHFIGEVYWSCVHLPIIYQMFCTLGPNNQLDPTRTISSYSNDSGYVRLVLSGALAGAVNDLDYVKLTGSTSPGIDGVYQIMEANSTSDVTIALAYDAYVFGSATVQKYYNNYHIVVNVYAGLNASHFWALQKPYELAGTLRFYPESSTTIAGKNEIRFSINEILKSYIKTTNNLTLATLPNNLDAFVQYYIETYESYDVGTGYSFINFKSAPISDQTNFEGYAVNAKLPFKNIQSGYLSDYVMNNYATGKFLTLFALPVMFAGCTDKDLCYYDVSFINPLTYNAGTLLYLRQAYYKSGVLQSSKDKLISNYDNGVYRAQPDNPSCTNDRVDLSIVKNGQTMIAPSSFLDGGVGSGFWGTKTGTLFVKNAPASSTFYSAYTPVTLPPGTVITLTVTVSGTNYVGPALGLQVCFELRDSTLNISNSINCVTLLSGSFSGQIVLPASTGQSAYFLVYGFYGGTSIDQISVTVAPAVYDTIYPISETKTVTINCDCNQQNIRLTWLNYLGGFDYWIFTTMKDYLIDIPQTAETKQNIFPNWPKSYGSNADTVRKQITRESINQIAIHSQNINEDELQALEYIKTSPLVQIINSRKDRRTVIVDKNSFKVYTDADKLHMIDLILTYTDDIPSQNV